jgi:chromate transporter
MPFHDGGHTEPGATLGLVMPSLVIVLILTSVLKSLKGNKLSSCAFYALRPASVGLIAAAGLTVVMISLLRLDSFDETALYGIHSTGRQ